MQADPSNGGKFEEPNPVSLVLEHEVSSPGFADKVGFYETARKFGTIYMYTKINA
jgi:hypothetical protein